MIIRRCSCLEGAKNAEGLTLIIDVFRAGNTIISCLEKGAEYVIPVGSLQRAYELKDMYPDHFLIGERKSIPPKGFDFGNSPSDISILNLENKKVILTTSAGTQGIVHAGNPNQILIATFGNASTVVDYIRQKRPSIVSIVAMGFGSNENAEEDELCSWYLEQSLIHNEPDFGKIRNKLLRSKGADRLRKVGKQDDIKFCLQLNNIQIIPEYDFQTKKIIRLN